VQKTFVTYGFSRSADYRAEEVVASGMTNRFAVFARGERLGEVFLRAPGRHNVSNALAAAAVAWSSGSRSTRYAWAFPRTPGWGGASR